MAISMPFLAFSQADFKKGFVITLEKDTLFGLVGYREGSKSYKACDFRKSTAEEIVTYQPNEIAGYGIVRGKFFVSRTIQEKKREPNLIFLEMVVKGLVSLYKFGEVYFLEKDDGVLRQLINEKEEAFVGDNPQQYKRRVLLQSNEHIAIMNMLLVDCSELSARIPKVHLTERQLTELIEDYNTCKGVPFVTYKTEKPWVKTYIGVTGGGNFSKLDFIVNEPAYKYLDGTFSTSKTPLAGLSLDITSPRLNERLSFHADFFYLNSKYYLYSITNTSSSITHDYISIELQQIKVPIGIRYTFPEKAITPYFNVGASNTVNINSSSSWIREIESGNTVNTYTNDALDITRNQLGFWGGIGVLKSVSGNQNAFIELRYEQTNGITQQVIQQQQYLKSSIMNVQILFGIRTK